ncbi:MAG: putative lipid II flippase FtsW [Bacilli bacterium]|nr:putative lipid II flippase FtsW [Bacilli bacterium]
MRKMNITLVIAVTVLSLFGLLMVYSSSYVWAEYKFDDAFKYVKNQGMFLILGLILMFAVSKVHFEKYYKYSNKIFLVCFILLVLVLFVGTERNGSKSWFGIGSFGIQPSEFMKLAMIIFTSKYLYNNRKDINNIKKGVIPILGLTLVVFALIMLQPDFGTGLILVMGIIGLLFVGGVDLKFFLKIGLVGVGGIVALIAAAPYRLKRILSFLNPWEDPLGSGFQIIQSLYAIGPGGLFGFGLGGSRQKHFYLPEPQTDFIFSIISEEFGFVGILIVASLFITIIALGIKIALKCENLFGKYLAFGIIFELGFQALLNLMVVVGLIPVTGVTLPFLSYGGSSLMITLMSIGIILNISRHQK